MQYHVTHVLIITWDEDVSRVVLRRSRRRHTIAWSRMTNCFRIRSRFCSTDWSDSVPPPLTGCWGATRGGIGATVADTEAVRSWTRDDCNSLVAGGLISAFKLDLWRHGDPNGFMVNEIQKSDQWVIISLISKLHFLSSASISKIRSGFVSSFTNNCLTVRLSPIDLLEL